MELSEKIPTIIKVQSDWKYADGTMQPFSAAFKANEGIRAVLGPAVVPMLEWQSGEDGSPLATVTTKYIASGQYDECITQFAREVKQYGKPLFIRLMCGEFNGNWWKWCSPKANPDSGNHVFLYDGKVSFYPFADDFDQRLIAGGADMRALFARRIANPRYISRLVNRT